MTPDDRWLAAVWPFVRRQLPSAPARVLEVGCGPLGGFVPALLEDGYKAVGVDPEAPEGSDYQQVEVERHDPPWPVDCVVASTSLHHVADLDEVLDRLEALLVPGGVLVVVEWAWERWAASGRPWENYCRTWAEHEGLHPGEEILRGLDARFDRQLYVEGPYFFADLADTSQAEEQAAIDAGQIRAGGIRYAATRA
jgi:SAM-dependent methyltransferase